MTVEQALGVLDPDNERQPLPKQREAFEVLCDAIATTRFMLRYDTNIHDFHEIRRNAATKLKGMLIED